ncbi:MAG TPA: hypothetical protein VM488_19320 [Pseudobacter sp.]|nr:hypothetical protein [Pseudobacter sp.]
MINFTPQQVWATISIANTLENVQLSPEGKLINPLNLISIRMMATTAFPYLAINEEICQLLKFSIDRKTQITMPDGNTFNCEKVSGVVLRFGNRSDMLGAYVLPGNSTPLLGAIPMQLLDVIIDPEQNKLIVHPERPDMALTRLPGIRLPRYK